MLYTTFKDFFKNGGGKVKKAETKDRIKEALEIRGMKQSELVERTGIDKGQMSSYISGKYKPKQKNLHLIAKVLSVDEAWLMGYDVPIDGCIHGSSEPKLPKIMQYYGMLNTMGKETATEQVRLLTLDKKYTKPDNVISIIREPESDYLAPDAAHKLPNASPEDKQYDENIMNDDNF